MYPVGQREGQGCAFKGIRCRLGEAPGRGQPGAPSARRQVGTEGHPGQWFCSPDEVSLSLARLTEGKLVGEVRTLPWASVSPPRIMVIHRMP